VRRAFLAAVFLTGAGADAIGQEKPAERGVQLALDGRCTEAMPLLKRAVGEALAKDLKRKVGKAGVRCSMLPGQQDSATSFLAGLQREFPQDADILFLAVHVYSDLALLNSQALMNSAPDSQEAIQLNSENFEKQGRPQEGDCRVSRPAAAGARRAGDSLSDRRPDPGGAQHGDESG
jgi:hypothetical protein